MPNPVVGQAYAQGSFGGLDAFLVPPPRIEPLTAEQQRIIDNAVRTAAAAAGRPPPPLHQDIAAGGEARKAGDNNSSALAQPVAASGVAGQSGGRRVTFAPDMHMDDD